MAKEIVLTNGAVAVVDDEDYERLFKFKWVYLKRKFGTNAGYARRRAKTKTILMHREITDAPKGLQADHIDGNGLNNQRSNLRLCTAAQNQWNRSQPLTNTSGYKGVYFNTKLMIWIAQISLGPKTIYLGKSHDIRECAEMYDAAAKKHHGEFAWLNFPEEKD